MSSESPKNNNPLLSKEKKINFGTIWHTYLHKWWWFAISLVIFIGLGVVFLHYKMPKYEIQASIMLNQDSEDSGGSVGGLSALMSSFSLGGGSGSNMEDELYKIESHTTYTDVVKRLGLNKMYWTRPDIFSRKVIYFEGSPIRIDVPDAVLDTISKSTLFKISIANGGKDITIYAKQGKKWDKTVEVKKLPYMMKTPLASFRISTTEFYNKNEDLNLKAVVSNPSTTAIDLAKEVHVSAPSKKSNAIELSMENVSVEEGELILNTVIDVYNERALSDRQEEAANTARFIEERLLKLYTELETAEGKIETYKKENQIVDAEAEAEYIFKKKEMIESNALEYETKASVLTMVKDFLMTDANKYSLVPFSSNLPDDPVTKYNELVLERMKIEGNGKTESQLLRNLTRQVDAMRANIISSIDRDLASTRIALADMNRVAGASTKRMAGIPKMEKDLTALYRDQIVKNQIYAYLLQKREESEVKMSRITPSGKLIDVAYSDGEPVSPNKGVVLGGCFLLGLIVPGLILFGKTDKSKIVTSADV